MAAQGQAREAHRRYYLSVLGLRQLLRETLCCYVTDCHSKAHMQTQAFFTNPYLWAVLDILTMIENSMVIKEDGGILRGYSPNEVIDAFKRADFGPHQWYSPSQSTSFRWCMDRILNGKSTSVRHASRWALHYHYALLSKVPEDAYGIFFNERLDRADFCEGSLFHLISSLASAMSAYRRIHGENDLGTHRRLLKTKKTYIRGALLLYCLRMFKGNPTICHALISSYKATVQAAVQSCWQRSPFGDNSFNTCLVIALNEGGTDLTDKAQRRASFKTCFGEPVTPSQIPYAVIEGSINKGMTPLLAAAY